MSAKNSVAAEVTEPSAAPVGEAPPAVKAPAKRTTKRAAAAKAATAKTPAAEEGGPPAKKAPARKKAAPAKSAAKKAPASKRAAKGTNGASGKTTDGATVEVEVEVVIDVDALSPEAASSELAKAATLEAELEVDLAKDLAEVKTEAKTDAKPGKSESGETEAFEISDSDIEDEPVQQVTVAGATADPVKDYLKQIGKVPAAQRRAGGGAGQADRGRAVRRGEARTPARQAGPQAAAVDLEWIVRGRPPGEEPPARGQPAPGGRRWPSATPAAACCSWT